MEKFSLTPFCPTFQEYIRHRSLNWDARSQAIFNETFAGKCIPLTIISSKPDTNKGTHLVVAEPALLRAGNSQVPNVSLTSATSPPTNQTIYCRIITFGLRAFTRYLLSF